MSNPKSYILNLYPNLALTQLAKLWAEAEPYFKIEHGRYSAKHHAMLAAQLAQQIAGIAAAIANFNDHEPTSSLDPPNPPSANYFMGDDHVYHHINGVWKRISLSTFQ